MTSKRAASVMIRKDCQFSASMRGKSVRIDYCPKDQRWHIRDPETGFSLLSVAHFPMIPLLLEDGPSDAEQVLDLMRENTLAGFSLMKAIGWEVRPCTEPGLIPYRLRDGSFLYNRGELWFTRPPAKCHAKDCSNGVPDSGLSGYCEPHRLAVEQLGTHEDAHV